MSQNYLVDRDLRKLKKSKNNVILFGEVGNGKTTLINKLCGTVYEVREGGYSCTREIQYGLSKDRNIIIDCPGLNAAEDIVQHLKVQKFILSVIPIRIICFVIKLSTRYDLLLRAASRMLKIFYRHKDNISIIITFCEELGNKQMKEILSILKTKLGFDETKVIFSSNLVSSSDILKRINTIKSSVSNIDSIIFNEQSLLSKYEEGGLEIVEFKENMIREFKKALTNFKSHFGSLHEPLIKNALLYTFKYYMWDLCTSYKEKLNTKMQDIVTINVESLIFSNELDEGLNAIIGNYEKDSSENQSEKEKEDFMENPIFHKISCQTTKNFCLQNQTQSNNYYLLGEFKDCRIIFYLDNFKITISRNNFMNCKDLNNKKNIEEIKEVSSIKPLCENVNSKNNVKNTLKSVDKLRIAKKVNNQTQQFIGKKMDNYSHYFINNNLFNFITKPEN